MTAGRRAFRRYSPCSPGAGGRRIRRRRSAGPRRGRRVSPIPATAARGSYLGTSHPRGPGLGTRDKYRASLTSTASSRNSLGSLDSYMRPFPVIRGILLPQVLVKPVVEHESKRLTSIAGRLG